jgi:ribonuclease HI
LAAELRRRSPPQKKPLAALGRKRVAILHTGNLELPSDIHGLVYIPFKKHVSEVKQALAAELQEVGFHINIKDLLGGWVKRVTIHSDGACLGNPGPGGWAAVLEYGRARKELVGADIATTNNRMELEAAIQALHQLKEPCEVELYTDSEYLRDGITKWIQGWKARGWKKKIKNTDLWQELDRASAKHNVSWHWVRGHSGHPGNERCDFLAMKQAEQVSKTSTREQLAIALAEFEKKRSSANNHDDFL